MRNYLSLITFSHTVFALPFALIGFALGIMEPGESFTWIKLLLVIACMVFARSAAMAFNRVVDAPYDAANARTVTRDIPAGKIAPLEALLFVAMTSVAFVVCAGLLNRACLLLSPIALVVILGYSYAKRFTWLCHLILGLGLALAPIGAYIAVTAHFALNPILLGLVVLTWVSGFDIVYALQDESFDRSVGLNSVPTRFGESRSLGLARLLHLISFTLLLMVTYSLDSAGLAAKPFLWGSAAMFGLALLYQHRLVRPGDLAKIDRAFFTTNGLASVAYAGVLIAGFLVQNYI